MKQRVIEPELMDDPAIAVARHQQALRGLARLNRFSRSAQIVYAAIADLLQEAPRPIRLLDLATGGGDVPIGLSHLARRHGTQIQIAACDVSSTAIEYARHRAALADVEIDFFPLNVMTQSLPLDYDVITCSLFLHHLTGDHARRLLSSMMAAAGQRIVVNDLCRGRVPLAMVKLAVRVVSRSAVVHVDGPRSVRAAFTAAELRELAAEAGLTEARVETRWPARLLLTCDRAPVPAQVAPAQQEQEALA